MTTGWIVTSGYNGPTLYCATTEEEANRWYEEHARELMARGIMPFIDTYDMDNYTNGGRATA